MARGAAGGCRGESSFALQPLRRNAPQNKKRIPPGEAKPDARRDPQYLVIPGLTRNPVRQS
ncbi:MAG: hypothetical protein LBS70_01765, partial [Candidatus Accumulibacter sp.]|nr:hypothetical protein [Accumulibacter sp.]